MIIFIILLWCCAPNQKDRLGKTETPGSTKEVSSKVSDVASKPSAEEKLMSSLSPTAKTKLEKEIARFAICELYFKEPSEVTVKSQNDFYIVSYQEGVKFTPPKLKLREILLRGGTITEDGVIFHQTNH